MRRMKARLTSIIMSLVLVFSLFTGLNLKTEAAGVDMSVRPLVSNSMYEQSFEVYMSVAGEYDLYYNGVVTQQAVPLGAGTQTLTFATSDPADSIGIDIWALDENGEWDSRSADSLNPYYAPVKGIGEDGTVLFEDTVRLGYYSDYECTYEAPAEYDTGDTVYYCNSNIHVLTFGEEGYTFTYSKDVKQPRNIQINYVDGQNQQIGSTTETLNYGDVLNFEAPATYDANGKTYTLLSNAYATMSYDTASDVYTFEYAENIPAPEAPYEITINFVDTADNAIFYSTTMTVDVNSIARMELPSVYYTGLKQYQLVDGTPNFVEREFSSTRATTYDIPYAVASETMPYDVAINFVGDDGTSLGRMTTTLTADGEPWVYALDSTPVITTENGEYRLISGQGNANGQIVCAYNGDAASRQLEYQVVYTLETVEVPQPYEITLRYIDIGTNNVIQTVAQQVAVGETVTFNAAPESLTVDGTNLVRINGQDAPISHNYDEVQTDYAVYYIDPTIPAPEVVAVDETVTEYVTLDDGTAVPEAVPVTLVTTTEGDVTAAFTADGQPLNVADGTLTPVQDEEVPLADTNNLTGIEDEETPKADMNTNSFAKTLPWICGIAVLIVLIVLFLVSKKRKSE
ncbi:MAG: hypothetical protein EOM34_01050 [Clostridia bacterium]|nr:hypothetical protein [Clostridia bacterium]NCD01398.1 hypothetical protein [Clostridia bacterium]